MEWQQRSKCHIRLKKAMLTTNDTLVDRTFKKFERNLSHFFRLHIVRFSFRMKQCLVP